LDSERCDVPGTVLIYGATGYMGGLTARAALDRGLRPLLAGRTVERLTLLATELELEYRVASLADQEALDRSLRGVSVLLNAAGPFSATWQPLVEACLRCGVHYLDLTGEVLVFEAMRARGGEARHRGILLLPGVGFDVVPSDCLAAHVAARLPGAKTLRLAVSGLELVSKGSAVTLAEQLGRPPLVRRRGRLMSIPAGSLEHVFDFGSGPAASVAVSWGDLATAFNTTGIDNIETYFEATPAVRAMTSVSRFWGAILATPPWQLTLHALASWLPPGPDAAERGSRAAVIVAEVEHPSGRIACARLCTPEAYTLSAQTAVAIAAEVASGNYEPGFQTPARLYGADYILQFDGVTRETIVG
jgi:short subunit dehydrogenase-like uncharacterized protein